MKCRKAQTCFFRAPPPTGAGGPPCLLMPATRHCPSCWCCLLMILARHGWNDPLSRPSPTSPDLMTLTAPLSPAPFVTPWRHAGWCCSLEISLFFNIDFSGRHTFKKNQKKALTTCTSDGSMMILQLSRFESSLMKNSDEPIHPSAVQTSI